MAALVDVMEDQDYAYLVLELCKGPDLEQVLEVRILTLPKLASLRRGSCVFSWQLVRQSRPNFLLAKNRNKPCKAELCACMVTGARAVPGARGSCRCVRHPEGHLALP